MPYIILLIVTSKKDHLVLPEVFSVSSKQSIQTNISYCKMSALLGDFRNLFKQKSTFFGEEIYT